MTNTGSSPGNEKGTVTSQPDEGVGGRSPQHVQGFCGPAGWSWRGSPAARTHPTCGAQRAVHLPGHGLRVVLQLHGAPEVSQLDEPGRGEEDVGP